MLTAGFNHRGQTLLHFGTIGLGPKSKRTWILYSAERTIGRSRGYTCQQNRGRSGDRPRTEFGFDGARFNALARGFPQPRCDLRDRLRRITSWQLSILDGWTAPLMAPVARDDSGR